MTAPLRDEAQSRGCLCGWYGDNCIVVFHPECPIGHLHIGNPNAPNWEMITKEASDEARRA